MSTSIREHVGITISRTARTWRTKLDERLSLLGLTQARWLVLMHLSRMGGESLQKELAFVVGVEGPTLVRVLDGLERIGLVQRLDYLLHIPLSLMRKENAFYISVVRYLRHNLAEIITNPYLSRKNKIYLLLLAPAPRLLRTLHAGIRRVG